MNELNLYEDLWCITYLEIEEGKVVMEGDTPDPLEDMLVMEEDTKLVHMKAAVHMDLEQEHLLDIL